MLQGYSTCVVLLCAVFGVSSKGPIFSPIGPRLCELMCENAGMCKYAFFHRLYLRCAFFNAEKDFHKLALTRNHRPCGSSCAKSEKCINTRLTSWLCVRSEPRSGGTGLDRFPKVLHVKSNNIHFHSSALLAVNPKVNVVALPIKHNSTQVPDPPNPQCLVTVTRTRTHSTVNLVDMATHVWYQLHHVKGRIHAVRSRDSHLFWCQQQPSLCGSFKFKLDGSKPQELQTKIGIIRTDIAVDVTENKIFLIGQMSGFEVRTLQWKRTKNLNNRFGIKLVEVSTILRMLYLVKKDGKTVVMYTYKGIYVNEAVVSDRCFSLDVGTENRIYLTAKKKRLFVVTLWPDLTPEIKTLTFSSRMPHRVLVFNSTVFVYRTSKIYRLIDNKRLDKKPVFSIPQAWFHRVAPIVFASGVEGLKEDSSCKTPSHDLDQLVVLAVNHYTRLGHKTNFFTLSVPGGEMILLKELSVKMFHFSTAGPFLFYTSDQYLAMFPYKGSTNATQVLLYTGQCFHVAADTEEKMVFFVSTRGIVRSTFTKGDNTVWNVDIEGSLMEVFITLDTGNRYVYVHTFKKKEVRRFTYSGSLQLTIETKNTIRLLVLDLENNCFLAVLKDIRLRMDIIDIPDPNKRGTGTFRVRGSYSAGTINYIALLDQHLVLQDEQSLTLLCRSSFKYLTSIDLKEQPTLQSVLGTVRRLFN